MIPQNNNIISLFQTNDLAKIFNVGQFKIGEYHMGKIGTDWMVWSNKFHSTFNLGPGKNDNFDLAKKKAYDIIKSYCIEKKIAPPPPPPK